jgi:hypothetical protein
VSLHQLTPAGPQSLRELWSKAAHAGSVNSVRVTRHAVLTGGTDRSMCLIPLGDGWQAGEPLRLHRTLNCTGMLIDGVRGDAERSMLEDRLRESAADASNGSSSPAIPSPLEVFGARRGAGR